MMLHTVIALHERKIRCLHCRIAFQRTLKHDRARMIALQEIFKRDRGLLNWLLFVQNRDRVRMIALQDNLKPRQLRVNAFHTFLKHDRALLNLKTER